MDAWHPDQLRKMQAGGNAKLNDFFARYGIDKATDIKVKYNNRVAEIYRELIKAEAEGQPYTPPAPGSFALDLPPTPPGSALPTPPGSAAASTGRRTPGPDDGWNDWGNSGGAGGGGAGGGGGVPSNSSVAASASAASIGGSTTPPVGYSAAQLQASAAGKDAYFERRLQENAARPEGLPPNQGGKYIGFGSAPAPAARPGGSGSGRGSEEVSQMLSKGLQTLTVVAGTAAGSATEALRHGKEHVSALLAEQQVTERARHVKEKSAALASAGWSGLQRLYANVASTVETKAKDSGYSIDLKSRQVAARVQEKQQHAAAGGFFGSGGGGGGAQYGVGEGGIAQPYQQEPQQWGEQQQQQQQQAQAQVSSSSTHAYQGASWDEWDGGSAGGGAGAGGGGPGPNK